MVFYIRPVRYQNCCCVLQAVNKLAEVMARKDPSRDKGKKVSQSEMRKKEKECRKLQQELQLEKEKFNKTVTKLQQTLSEAQATIYDVEKEKNRLQMELVSQESEIEALQTSRALNSSDASSVHSGNELDGSGDELLDARLEGWVSVPNKQNIKRHGWKKQYVVVSSKKVPWVPSRSGIDIADNSAP